MDFPTTPGVDPGARRASGTASTGAPTPSSRRSRPSGSALVYSTYLYGELDDAGNAIAVDGAGNAYVVGTTNSLLFPILDAFQSSNRGLDDAFVVKLNPDATRLVYSSYLGGSRSGAQPGDRLRHGNGHRARRGRERVRRGLHPVVRPADDPGCLPAEPRRRRLRRLRDTACGDGFVAKISAGGPGVTPAVNLTVEPGRRRAGRDARRHLGRQPDAHGERLPPPVHARLRGRRVRRRGDLLADAECRRRPAAAPAAGRPAGRLVRAPAAEPGPELGPPGPDRPERADPDRRLDPPPPPPGASCDDGTASACDDGDPCTDDACVPGVGCVSTPVSGFASVTCTCGRSVPAACADQRLPASIGGRRRARLPTSSRTPPARPVGRSVRRLRKAVQTLTGSIRAVTSGRRRTVSVDCAGALKGELRDTRDRATRLLATSAKR